MELQSEMAIGVRIQPVGSHRTRWGRAASGAPRVLEAQHGHGSAEGHEQVRQSRRARIPDPACAWLWLVPGLVAQRRFLIQHARRVWLTGAVGRSE